MNIDLRGDELYHRFACKVHHFRNSLGRLLGPFFPIFDKFQSAKPGKIEGFYKFGLEREERVAKTL